MTHTHVKFLTAMEQAAVDKWLATNQPTVIPVGVKALTRKGNRKDAASNV